MAVRVSPYMLSLIDWNDPYNDPIRRQFIPLKSGMHPDHPRLTLDSLHEQRRRARPRAHPPLRRQGAVLALQTCPVYCRFCTRSYAIGLDTDDVEKVHSDDAARVAGASSITSRRVRSSRTSSSPAAMRISFRRSSITLIGEALLAIPHVRRMRFATKGPAVMPMKILTDDAWLDALTGVVDEGRKLGKEVVLHTHFNHPNEITRSRSARCNASSSAASSCAIRAS